MCFKNVKIHAYSIIDVVKKLVLYILLSGKSLLETVRNMRYNLNYVQELFNEEQCELTSENNRRLWKSPASQFNGRLRDGSAD